MASQAWDDDMVHLNEQSIPLHKRRREVWPDAVKGACIVLVVLLHVVSKQYTTVGWNVPGVLVLGWEGMSSLLAPIRMPLFFAISGYFSASYLTRVWRATLGRRVLPVFALYIVWLTIHTVLFLFLPSLNTNMVDGPGGYLLAVVVGYTSLWYLYALPVYLVIAKLCASAPRTSLALAAVVALLSATTVFPAIGNSPSLLRNFVFFLAGFLLTRHISQLAEQRNALRLPAWSALFVIAAGAHSLGIFATDAGNFAMDLGLSIVQMAASVLGIIVGVGLAAAAARRWPKASARLAWVGRRTLPIYVLHLPLLALLNLALSGTFLPRPLAAIYPAVATTILVLACIKLSSLLSTVKCGWLFEPKALMRKSREGATVQ